jgi:hypothetical protein
MQAFDTHAGLARPISDRQRKNAVTLRRRFAFDGNLRRSAEPTADQNAIDAFGQKRATGTLVERGNDGLQARVQEARVERGVIDGAGRRHRGLRAQCICTASMQCELWKAGPKP